MARTAAGLAPLLCLAATLLTAVGAQLPAVLVVGSLNADVIVEVERLPSRGETLVARSPAAATAVGGKV